MDVKPKCSSSMEIAKVKKISEFQPLRRLSSQDDRSTKNTKAHPPQADRPNQITLSKSIKWLFAQRWYTVINCIISSFYSAESSAASFVVLLTLLPASAESPLSFSVSSGRRPSPP